MQTLSRHYELFEQHLKANAFYKTEPRQLYEAVNHIMHMPGKRIRPLLLMMANELFGGEVSSALNPALGIELFHNATLVHDDIMDEADIRRGLPTVHKKYGINHAIVTGDVMMIYAYQYLLQDHPGIMHELIQVYNRTTTEIMEGQTMDLQFEKEEHVTAGSYLKMIEYKTSVLLAAALEIGAILAGASAADRKLIHDFGLNLGLSFQIKDDLLDAFGTDEKVGKKIGGDILRNKKTYLYIRTTELATADQLVLLKQLVNESREDYKISETLRLFTETGAQKDTELLAEQYYQAACKAIASVSSAAEQKEPLIQLAEAIHQRTF